MSPQMTAHHSCQPWPALRQIWRLLNPLSHRQPAPQGLPMASPHRWLLVPPGTGSPFFSQSQKVEHLVTGLMFAEQGAGTPVQDICQLLSCGIVGVDAVALLWFS